MMIIDPVALGDVACTRASTKMVYDRTGTLVSVAANTLAVTYDPSDLTKAPFVLWEPVAATNFATGSESLSSANGWAGASVNGTTASYRSSPYIEVKKLTSTANESRACPFGAIGTGVARTMTFAMRAGTSPLISFGLLDASAGTNWGANSESVGVILSGPGVLSQSNGALFAIAGLSSSVDTVVQLTRTFSVACNGTAVIYPGRNDSVTTGDSVLVTQVQVTDVVPSLVSYIPTTTVAVTRAADTIATGAGLAYSNVAITEPDYSAGTTYAANAVVHDPATHLTYKSLVASNVGNALTDTTKWTPNGATNRWLMFDQYNVTQTSNAEEIIVVCSPQAISPGLFLGNVDASEVRLSVVDLTEGLVSQVTQSLIMSNSGSSFYNWGFKPILRQNYFVNVAMPPYANALVTIAIKKPGGTPKCGVCALGPLVDVGLSQYGISREIKDYSTINFNFDGTSNQVVRPFAKRMDIDVVINNSMIDYVISALEARRQKPVAWIGAKEFGSACLFGRYSAFKSVIENYPESKMNLQIEGTV